MDKNNKKLHGQFYTITNPFHNQLFLNWFNNIPNIKKEIILEPFAGANNIVQMIKEFYKNQWKCYDIQPNHELNKCSEFIIKQNDSLNNFPKGFRVSITNPPYLAKNSATRDKLEYPNTSYDDLYKYSLSVMLQNVDYIAAIIPESFITQNLFHERLFGVVSLNCRMFEDTEVPVCLALFSPTSDVRKQEIGEDFYVYRGNVCFGMYSELKNQLDKFLNTNEKIEWKFNNPKGEIGLYAVDSTTSRSIRFVSGDEINSSKIKVSSRGVTRISGLPQGIDFDDFIQEANKKLDEFRNKTNDVFLTSFRGLRKDGEYRRRLDFALAKVILNNAIEELK